MAYTNMAAIADRAKSFAVDLISGAIFGRTKIVVGREGEAVDVSADNPMPSSIIGSVAVTGPATNAQMRATPLDVAGPLTDAQIRASALAVALAGSLSLATGQGTATATASLLVAARAGRRSVVIVSGSATPMYLGGAGVTPATGVFLAGVVGASATLETEAAIYSVTASGSAAVSFVELY